MTTQNTQGEVLDRGKYGFAVRWTHVKPYAYESSMPDKETATLSAASSKLLEALWECEFALGRLGANTLEESDAIEKSYKRKAWEKARAAIAAATVQP